MTLWRLEVARLVRGRRLVALLGVFTFFGLTSPLLARYMDTILERFGGEVTVTVPDPVPADGITQYLANATQIGLLVVLVTAAGALAFDAKPELAAFLRSRVSIPRLVVPRYVVATAAACSAFAIGALAAWYETHVLLGPVPAAGMLAGIGFTWVYLAFAVAVVALCAGLTRSTLMTVLASAGLLVGLPVLGLVPALHPWVPSTLVGALDGLARGAQVGDYLRAAGVAVVASAGLLMAAVALLRRREL